MKRREFLSLAAVAAGGCTTAMRSLRAEVLGGGNPGPRRRALMKVGSQMSPTSGEMLQFFARHGVKNICGHPSGSGPKGTWNLDDLLRLRERVESHGISLDMVPLPLSSLYITTAENPNVMLGESPQRDREIDSICEMVRAAAKAGIPTLK